MTASAGANSCRASSHPPRSATPSSSLSGPPTGAPGAPGSPDPACHARSVSRRAASAVRVALTDNQTRLPALEPATHGEFLRVPFPGQLDELGPQLHAQRQSGRRRPASLFRHAPQAAKAQPLATSAETPTLFLFRLGGHPITQSLTPCKSPPPSGKPSSPWPAATPRQSRGYRWPRT